MKWCKFTCRMWVNSHRYRLAHKGASKLTRMQVWQQIYFKKCFRCLIKLNLKLSKVKLWQFACQSENLVTKRPFNTKENHDKHGIMIFLIFTLLCIHTYLLFYYWFIAFGQVYIHWLFQHNIYNIISGVFPSHWTAVYITISRGGARFEKFPTRVSLNQVIWTNGKCIFSNHLELRISNSSLASAVVCGHSSANQLALTGFFSECKMLPTIL